MKSKNMRWEYCYEAPCCDGVGGSELEFGISDVKTVIEASSSLELAVIFSPKGVLSHNLSSAPPSLVDCVPTRAVTAIRSIGELDKWKEVLWPVILGIGTSEIASQPSNTSPGGADEQITMAWPWQFVNIDLCQLRDH